MSSCSEEEKKLGATGANKVNWLDRINKAIVSGEFAKLPDFDQMFDDIRFYGNVNLHVFILASRGGVVSYLDHLYAFLEVVNARGAKPFVHLFSDGKDVPEKQFINDLPEIEGKIKEHNAMLASISGRFFAMDTNLMWDRTDRVAKAFNKEKGTPIFKSAEEYVKAQYSSTSDQWIVPAISEDYVASSALKKNDVFVNLNFDYLGTRQLCHTLVGSGDLYVHDLRSLPHLVLYEMVDDPRMFISGHLFRW